MDAIKIELPIDYYIHCGITQYTWGSAILSKRLTETLQRPIIVGIGTDLTIGSTDLELCMLIVASLQEERRKLSNDLLDIDQRQGKSLLRHIVAMHNLEIIDDSVLAEILLFCTVTVCRYLKVPLKVLKERMDEVYAKSKEIIEEM